MRGRRVSGFIAAVLVSSAVAVPAGAQSLDDALEVVGGAGDACRQLPGGLARGITGPLEPAFAALAGDACDTTDPLRCLLPFPNDRFTTADATTPTGLRVDLHLATMPRNVVGKPIDPTEWNRNDGFSPGSIALTYVAGLDLPTTFGLSDELEAQIQLPSSSIAPDAPIVLLDADTGLRHPYWAELDTHPDTTDDGRLLIVRPLRNLEPGHRYVVALRELRDADGGAIEAGPTFAALRDDLPPTACPTAPPAGDPEAGAGRPPHAGQPDRPPHTGEPGRPPHAGPDEPGDPDCPDDLPGEAGRYQRMFGDLTAVGVDVDELYLAWDFTVASSPNLTDRSLAIRDQAFTALGDEDLTDGVVAGDAPTFTITEVEDRPADRAIRGTITAPNFLTLPQNLPRLPPREFGTGVEQYLPGSRLYYGTPTPGPMDTPQVNPLSPTVEAEFVCHLPNQASADDPALPTLYGHGLLGGIGEAGGGSTSLLRQDNHLVCATPWIGMATEDVANVATILTDVSNFGSLPDRSQQGFLHFHLLGRLTIHPDGFAAHPAFQDTDDVPRIDTSEVVYDGNSQGGILGGSMVALAPDVRKAALGVPGGNYSTLLNRSVDWEGAYGEVLYATYPDKVDQQLIFALIQMLWDRSETNGYTHALTDRPLPNTPEHRVLFQLAFADHQVANIAAEVDARTSGARLLQTSLAEGRHWADITGQRDFGLEVFDVDEEGRILPHEGSAIMYVDSGNDPGPLGNTPPRDQTDPHGDPRSDPFAHQQKSWFLRTGVVHDTRAGEPYWSHRCRGPAHPGGC
ncbi:hypothetical protein [Nitriliruptor alkaliphilus]|uniref:hypothetical protein n=1 Tax=Nitriliruptor alkaliphilus TaxID=427918 RepID=UPI000699146C|nr:hypothetical protein [Nitriliruptor alkaliphilus]